MKNLLLFLSLFLLICASGKDSDAGPPPSSDSSNNSTSTTVEKFDLAVSASEGGSVDTSGGSYNSNSSVTIKATPANGYEFTGWSGNVTGSTNPLTLTVNGNKNITANFAALVKYQVTITKNEGGTINTTGGEYSQQSSVTLIATPGDGYSFIGWSGSVTSTENSLVILVDSDKNITANFEESIAVSEIIGKWDFSSNNSGSGKAAISCDVISIIFNSDLSFKLYTSKVTLVGTFNIRG